MDKLKDMDGQLGYAPNVYAWGWFTKDTVPGECPHGMCLDRWGKRRAPSNCMESSKMYVIMLASNFYDPTQTTY